MSLQRTCSPKADSVGRPIRRYEVDDRFTVARIPATAGTVDVWCPIIPDTSYQRVLALGIEGATSDILLTPPQRGGRLLFFAGPYAEVDGQPHRALERRIRFSEI